MPRLSACTPDAVTTISRGGIEIHALQRADSCSAMARRSGRQAGVFGVEREAVLHGADGGLLDVVRGGQVGFAEVQAQDAVHGHGDFGQFANARAGNDFDRGCDCGISDIFALPCAHL